jgi:hypothetical protein
MVAGPPPIRDVAIGAASPKAGRDFIMTLNIKLVDMDDYDVRTAMIAGSSNRKSSEIYIFLRSVRFLAPRSTKIR